MAEPERTRRYVTTIHFTAEKLKTLHVIMPIIGTQSTTGVLT